MERDLTEKEAAHALGVHLQKLKRLRWSGRITARRIGNGRGFIRYTPADLAAYRAADG